MDFIKNNWQFVFGGVGTAIVAAVLGAYLKYYFDTRAKAKGPSSGGVSQKIQSGNNSINVQAGRDADVTANRPPSR
jgi:hypothetical protein